MNLVLFKFAPSFVWERKLEYFFRIVQALLTCPQVLNVPVTQVFRKIIDTWTNMQVWCKFDTLQVCAHLVMRNKSRVFLKITFERVLNVPVMQVCRQILDTCCMNASLL